ncbi:hypothetical protein Tco_0599634 [Tanacetum coccineum]
MIGTTPELSSIVREACVLFLFPNGEILEVQRRREPQKDLGIHIAYIKAAEKKRLDDIRIVQISPKYFHDDPGMGLPHVREPIHQKPSGLLQQPEVPEWKWEKSGSFPTDAESDRYRGRMGKGFYSKEMVWHDHAVRNVDSPVIWTEVGESHYWTRNCCKKRLKRLFKSTERLKTAKNRQKLWLISRRQPLEFKVGDECLLKESPGKKGGSGTIGKKE